MQTPPPGTACACVCTLWRHVGICTGIATVSILKVNMQNKEREYHACATCAEAIMAGSKQKYVKT